MSEQLCLRCRALLQDGRLIFGYSCFTDEPEHANEECLLDHLDRERAQAAKDIKSDGGGLRFNAGKNRLDLIPPEWPWALGDVTTKGTYKYMERNWERGMRWSIMVGCTLRHLYKFLAGERYDAETGCHHLAMAAWNLLALMSYDLRAVGENDLPGTPTGMDKGHPERVLDRVNNGVPTHPAIRKAMGLDAAA